jgi:hypothetical protein
MRVSTLIVKSIGWCLIASLLAGLFGAIHNQISYSISCEYFTKFKFIQFQIPSSMPPRLGASLVGWLAAWWLGYPLAMLILPIAHWTSQEHHVDRRIAIAFGIVLAVAAGVGVLGLMLAMATGNPETIEQVSRYGNQMEDDLAFSRAGTMHNFSYLGATLGCLVAAIWLNRSRIGSVSAPEAG